MGTTGREPTLRLWSSSADVTVEIGRIIGSVLEAGDVVLLDGDLGAGKTTMTRGIAAGLGVAGPVSSPTFVVARTHEPVLNPDTGRPAVGLVHVDAYRLGSSVDLDELDLESELETRVLVAEWGSGRVEQLADSRLSVRIEPVDGTGDGQGAGYSDGEAVDEARVIEIAGRGSRWDGPGWVRLSEALGRLSGRTANGP